MPSPSHATKRTRSIVAADAATHEGIAAIVAAAASVDGGALSVLVNNGGGLTSMSDVFGGDGWKDASVEETFRVFRE